VEDVGDACGAATGCGGCSPIVEQLIRLEAPRTDGARRAQREVERHVPRSSEAPHGAESEHAAA